MEVMKMGIFDKKPTQSEILEIFLKKFKRFAEKQGLEVTKVSNDLYSLDQNRIDVSFRIIDFNKIKED